MCSCFHPTAFYRKCFTFQLPGKKRKTGKEEKGGEKGGRRPFLNVLCLLGFERICLRRAIRGYADISKRCGPRQLARCSGAAGAASRAHAGTAGLLLHTGPRPLSKPPGSMGRLQEPREQPPQKPPLSFRREHAASSPHKCKATASEIHPKREQFFENITCFKGCERLFSELWMGMNPFHVNKKTSAMSTDSKEMSIWERSLGLANFKRDGAPPYPSARTPCRQADWLRGGHAASSQQGTSQHLCPRAQRLQCFKPTASILILRTECFITCLREHPLQWLIQLFLIKYM